MQGSEILIKISSFKIERKNSIKAPSPIKIKCLIKKKYEFVSSLSEAIKDVDTKEKKRPKKNKTEIRKRINLSMFFHQS